MFNHKICHGNWKGYLRGKCIGRYEKGKTRWQQQKTEENRNENVMFFFLFFSPLFGLSKLFLFEMHLTNLIEEYFYSEAFTAI